MIRLIIPNQTSTESHNFEAIILSFEKILSSAKTCSRLEKKRTNEMKYSAKGICDNGRLWPPGPVQLFEKEIPRRTHSRQEIQLCRIWHW